MNGLDIARRRLHNQRLTGANFKRPQDVVRWLGAVQAQEYAGAKWALALRAESLTDADVDQAFADGKILRTHVLRPTWHFVTPADIRPMLQLTAPRVNTFNASYYRKLELDEATFARSTAALTKALQGNRQLTRPELSSVFRQAGIATDDFRLTYLVMRAELDGLVCSGARRGKQFTYALLDERVPKAKTFKRDEALAELSRRYLTSRGPATVKDFVWWSGLTTADAKAGIEMVSSQFKREVVAGQTYWFPDDVPPPRDTSPVAHLLSTYDEYLIGYKDRSASISAASAARILGGETFTSTIVLDGRVVGAWRRTVKKKSAVIETDFFTPPTKAASRAVAAAAHRYGDFLGVPVELT